VVLVVQQLLLILMAVSVTEQAEKAFMLTQTPMISQRME